MKGKERMGKERKKAGAGEGRKRKNGRKEREASRVSVARYVGLAKQPRDLGVRCLHLPFAGKGCGCCLHR